jgi:hypothetical protein
MDDILTRDNSMNSKEFAYLEFLSVSHSANQETTQPAGQGARGVGASWGMGKREIIPP